MCLCAVKIIQLQLLSIRVMWNGFIHHVSWQAGLCGCTPLLPISPISLRFSKDTPTMFLTSQGENVWSPSALLALLINWPGLEEDPFVKNINLLNLSTAYNSSFTICQICRTRRSLSVSLCSQLYSGMTLKIISTIECVWSYQYVMRHDSWWY